MSIPDFIEKFPDEASCKAKFKEYRDQTGVLCSKCGGKEHYWKKDKEQYECKSCKTRTTLKSGTVMHKSKLPFRYWFIAMHLLTSTKKSFSAKEIQRQLGHKRYHPIWHMVHKLRESMGKRDGEYILAGRIELDKSYFSAEIPTDRKEKTVKRGQVSNKKSKILVMAENELVKSPKKGKKARRVGYLKMKVIEGLKSETINDLNKKLAAEATEVDTDDSMQYADLKEYISRYNSQVIPKEKAGEILPWVHMVTDKEKRQLLKTLHAVKPEFLQNYLDEFWYKFNCRYNSETLFNRLLVACVSYKNEFKYKSG